MASIFLRIARLRLPSKQASLGILGIPNDELKALLQDAFQRSNSRFILVRRRSKFRQLYIFYGNNLILELETLLEVCKYTQDIYHSFTKKVR